MGKAKSIIAVEKIAKTVKNEERVVDSLGVVADGARKASKAGAKAVNLEKSALQSALSNAKPTSGHPNQLMTTLEEGTRVIFRKDFGKESHTVGGPFQGAGKVDHYNIEIQSAKGKTIENIHVVPGENGFTFWGKDGIIK